MAVFMWAALSVTCGVLAVFSYVMLDPTDGMIYTVLFVLVVENFIRKVGQ